MGRAGGGEQQHTPPRGRSRESGRDGVGAGAAAWRRNCERPVVVVVETRRRQGGLGAGGCCCSRLTQLGVRRGWWRSCRGLRERAGAGGPARHAGAFFPSSCPRAGLCPARPQPLHDAHGPAKLLACCSLLSSPALPNRYITVLASSNLTSSFHINRAGVPLVVAPPSAARAPSPSTSATTEALAAAISWELAARGELSPAVAPLTCRDARL